jgi:UDP-GlcNAc:undecaprenyl-phosphate GlcNAc-1-phosphate transferase
MTFWELISCTLVGMGIVFLSIPAALRVARVRGLLQRGQDPHHTHHQPVPRMGGLVLAMAFIGTEIFIAVAFPEQRTKTPGRLVVLLSSLTMFALGFWDDLKPLGAKRKLMGQIAIALSVCAFGFAIQKFKVPFTSTTLELGGWGVFLTVLWLVGMTNLINLIDGVDGLAGGISLMLMGLLAYVGHQGGGFECLVAGMAGALIGFLWFNFPPARVYLGDSGAYFLGFQIGLFALINSHKGTVLAAMVAPLFVLALPILDTGLAILRRGLRGLPIFRADRRHLHHHLLQMGLSRRRVIFYFYGVTLLFLAMAFAAYWSRGNLIPVLLGVGTLVLLLCAGRLRFSRGWFDVGRVVGDSLQMREEIQYTLTLMRWLELEGDRHSSAEELWSDLAFAAQRLGYSSVKMSLADGERVWSGANGCLSTRSVVQTLQGGRLGTLELKAPACETSAVPLQGTQPCERSFCHCVADERVFEIVSELLAEGWVKAVRRLENGDQAPLRFDTRRASPSRLFRRRFSLFAAAPSRSPQAGQKPADALGGAVR